MTELSSEQVRGLQNEVELIRIRLKRLIRDLNQNAYLGMDLTWKVLREYGPINAHLEAIEEVLAGEDVELPPDEPTEALNEAEWTERGRKPIWEETIPIHRDPSGKGRNERVCFYSGTRPMTSREQKAWERKKAAQAGQNNDEELTETENGSQNRN